MAKGNVSPIISVYDMHAALCNMSSPTPLTMAAYVSRLH